jgi:hypothetical protein
MYCIQIQDGGLQNSIKIQLQPLLNLSGNENKISRWIDGNEHKNDPRLFQTKESDLLCQSVDSTQSHTQDYSNNSFFAHGSHKHTHTFFCATKQNSEEKNKLTLTAPMQRTPFNRFSI